MAKRFLVATFLSLALRAQSSQPLMRVGTYDSRAIAVAYAHSDSMRQWYTKLVAERDQAKVAGDEKRLKEIEAEGKGRQERLHQQGFSTASVVDLMGAIKAEIPGIAKGADVVLIVSKWEIVYRDPAIEYVDVTLALVKKFGADAKVLKVVEELMKRDPL